MECRHILLLFGVLHEIIVVRHGVKLLTKEGVSSSELKISSVSRVSEEERRFHNSPVAWRRA